MRLGRRGRSWDAAAATAAIARSCGGSCGCSSVERLEGEEVAWLNDEVCGVQRGQCAERHVRIVENREWAGVEQAAGSEFRKDAREGGAGRAEMSALPIGAWLRASGSLKVSGSPHVRMACSIGTEAVGGAPPAAAAERVNIDVG